MDNHRLQDIWSIYYQEDNAQDDWETSIHRIGQFNSIESFWPLFSHILPPSKIVQSGQLQVFRKNIRGVWEDPENRDGGRFFISFRQDFNDIIWQKVVLLLIGEQLPEEIHGIILSIKNIPNVDQFFILSLWVPKQYPPQRIEEIKRELSDKLGIQIKKFQLHNTKTRPKQNYVPKGPPKQ